MSPPPPPPGQRSSIVIAVTDPNLEKLLLTKIVAQKGQQGPSEPPNGETSTCARTRNTVLVHIKLRHSVYCIIELPLHLLSCFNSFDQGVSVQISTSQSKLKEKTMESLKDKLQLPRKRKRGPNRRAEVVRNKALQCTDALDAFHLIRTRMAYGKSIVKENIRWACIETLDLCEEQQAEEQRVARAKTLFGATLLFATKAARQFSQPAKVYTEKSTPLFLISSLSSSGPELNKQTDSAEGNWSQAT